MRVAGTALLAVGFLALATAALIRDPAALDANIGAGILSLFGIPAGAVGLVLLLIDWWARRAASTLLPAGGRRPRTPER